MEKQQSIKWWWNRYQLRWLFYRQIPSMEIPSYKWDKYTSKDRCSKCKNGVNFRLVFFDFTDNTPNGSKSFCPRCNKDYIPEPNTNLSFKVYTFLKFISNLFWKCLDKLHIVRSSHDTRYSFFGDESNYIIGWKYDGMNKKSTPILKERKWYEYIIIEKK